jgi:L-2-hydroxyglutarate oxidase LhgO
VGRRAGRLRRRPARAESFYAAIRTYWPALPDGALVPGYAGIRPKLGPAGSPAADFVVQGPAEHRVPGLVNLFGIESPGLTASGPSPARSRACWGCRTDIDHYA